MHGLNMNVVDVSLDTLILMVPSLVVVLIAPLIWLKSQHHIARMVVNAVVCSELIRVMYLLVVMQMVWNYGH